jgi:uncharacterized damage-inducible protein DinB
VTASRRKNGAAAARTAELECLAPDLQMALWNSDAVACLLDRVPALHKADFGDEVAGGIRAIQQLASHAATKCDHIL